MGSFNKLSYEEDWHVGLVAEKLNQLVSDLNEKTGSNLQIVFNPHSDWIQGRMYLPYSLLTKHLKDSYGFVDEFGEVGSYSDWHQNQIQSRVNKLGEYVSQLEGDAPLYLFTAQPQGSTVDEYESATFNCSVSGGTAPYAYQWKKNGVNVGTNSNYLSFVADAEDNGASITVVVTDSVGNVITSTPTVLGVISYGFNFDGVTQYAQLSETIILPANQSFSIEMTGKLSPSGFYICAVNGTQEYRFTVLSSGNVFIPSTSIGTLSTTLWNRLKDGSLHTLKIERIGTTYTAYVDELSQVLTTSGTTDQMRFNSFCVHWGTSSPSSTGVFCRFIAKSNGVTLLDMPLNKKSLGATQTANSGSITATITNYNEAGWTAI